MDATTPDPELDEAPALLAKLRFPASRDELVREATESGAGEPLIARLENLPPDEYTDADHALTALTMLAPDSSRSDVAQR